ncbi:MAG TPA: DUF2500 family protein [Candidatus Fimenecus excrementavium]|nr:DUF2500 family protein [Candidatus Fimenecus excrementavium]
MIEVSASGNTIAVVLGIGAFVILAAILVSYLRANRKKHVEEKEEETFSEPLYEPVVKPATAVAKQVILRQKGSVKMPSHQLEFEVRFVCEDGEEIVLTVEPEAYERIPENQPGSLALVNGAFLDFQV